MLAGLVVSDSTNCQSPEDVRGVSEHIGKGVGRRGPVVGPARGPW